MKFKILQLTKIIYFCAYNVCLEKMESRKLFNKIEYLATCISAFGIQYKLSNAEAYNYLKRFGGIDFLIDCYEAEHTLSMENAVEDLQLLCVNNGGKLK